jgi:hypothetical protein
MTLERARGHDGWRARRPDLSQPSQAARSRNSASAPRYERPMSRRPGASAVATPTSTGQNAEVLTDAASAIAVGKRRRCTSRSQSGGPQPTGDRERNRPPVAPELGKQTRAEGQEMTPALYTAGASRPSVGTRPGSCGKRAFVDSRASTVAANDQAEAEVRGAESWLLQRRPGGTLGEAPALSTIRQRPLGFNDARAVGKEVCANRAASTCSSPGAQRVPAASAAVRSDGAGSPAVRAAQVRGSEVPPLPRPNEGRSFGASQLSHRPKAAGSRGRESGCRLF